MRKLRDAVPGSNIVLCWMMASVRRSKSRTGSTKPSACGVNTIFRPTVIKSSSSKNSRNLAKAALVADWLK